MILSIMLFSEQSKWKCFSRVYCVIHNIHVKSTLQLNEIILKYGTTMDVGDDFNLHPSGARLVKRCLHM